MVCFLIAGHNLDKGWNAWNLDSGSGTMFAASSACKSRRFVRELTTLLYFDVVPQYIELSSSLQVCKKRRD